MAHDYSEIVTLLGKYFDLLYNGNINMIGEVFLPEAHVYSLSDGRVVDVDMAGFRDRVANRPSPASQGEKREDRILSIDIAGPKTALAKVDCMILKSKYTDYLVLLKVDGKWGIISKIFHSDATS